MLENSIEAKGRVGTVPLQECINTVNKKASGRAIDAQRALLSGMADPRIRCVLIADIFSLVDTFNAMKRPDIIGRCESCDNFFLKARKDKKCCSRKCSNLFRVHKWRENYREK